MVEFHGCVAHTLMRRYIFGKFGVKMFGNLFSTTSSSKVDSYVYLYVDWRNDEVFYVGKGQGNRALDHIKGAENKSRWARTAKEKRIINIRRNAIQSDSDDMVIILHENLTDSEAQVIESLIISNIGLQNLTNKQSGLSESKWNRFVDDIDSKRVNKALNEAYELGVMDELMELNTSYDFKATLKNYWKKLKI